jgi:hypothetical protein
MLLSEQERAVAAHRDADRADAAGRPAETEPLAHRDQLVDDHRHRIVNR